MFTRRDFRGRIYTDSSGCFFFTNPLVASLAYHAIAKKNKALASFRVVPLPGSSRTLYSVCPPHLADSGIHGVLTPWISSLSGG